ncbi:hypothetical protein L6164_029163 [Bauhinia variegata]|uniref:Uncharacterized protein n=1 Tax=Bauhinia variegata TaxID=167791 RepID=A0ACB9L8I2_BAUVA|nr:hypothetical protein L6164_029163 [Bauhinia variegata]
MLRGSCRMPRTALLFSFFSQCSRPFVCWNRRYTSHPHFCHQTSFNVKHSLSKINAGSFSFYRTSHLSTLSQTAISSIDEPTGKNTNRISRREKKKAAYEDPANVLKHKLNSCSKHRNVVEALQLYDEARKNGIPLNLDHYNVLLYLCSSHSSVKLDESESNADISNSGLDRGFEIFQQMLIDKIVPNEATFTNAARLAAAREDPEMAFELVKQMKGFGIVPKLRSYEPALHGFCKKGDAEKAYEVDAEMIASGVMAEEPELSALLNLSANAKKEDKVYEILHRLRATVRQVSESTLQVIEDWFKSEDAAKVGEKNWDANKVAEGIVQGGGGWHGQGWLGSGRWKVVKTCMDETGMCLSCGEKLVGIDIDPKETENFAASLTRLACEREVKSNFNHFQRWLQQHGPFDAVVDGANVGLANMHDSFSFSRLKSVVEEIREMSPSKRMPLIILHKIRVTGGPAQSPYSKKLIEKWKQNGALYATPHGSNDDWYWLYAAVSCKCLLVTNDEMRDHLFQLLGSSFFPRWKEKHQVRLSSSTKGPTLIMPSPYSIVIQESANGSWHVPTVTGNDLDTQRQWLCATRSRDTSSQQKKRSRDSSLHHLWTAIPASAGT